MIEGDRLTLNHNLNDPKKDPLRDNSGVCGGEWERQEVIKFMVRIVAVFFLGTALAFGQQDHTATVNEHGDHVMGFSHDKTTHHFELNYDGGVIDARSDDARDTESRDEIRSHFRHIAQMFAEGNFDAPMLIHGK